MRHPEVTPTQYTLAQTTQTEFRAGGKPKKVTTPGAGPNAAGIVDYETRGTDDVYIRYMRSGVQGEGIPRRAMDALIEHHRPNSINFGKIMNPRMVDVIRSTSERHPNIYMHGHRDYGRDRGEDGPIAFNKRS